MGKFEWKGVSKPSQNERNKLHFWWLIIAIVSVIITYYYQKFKATSNYKTTLQIASQNCHLEVVKYSVKNLLDINARIPQLTALHYAAESGCLEVVNFLVNEEADLDNSYHGWTALHSAALKGDLEMVKFLLANQANPNIRNSSGKKPRDVAVIELRHNKDKPYEEIIDLLYDAEKQYEPEKKLSN